VCSSINERKMKFKEKINIFQLQMVSCTLVSNSNEVLHLLSLDRCQNVNFQLISRPIRHILSAFSMHYIDLNLILF
jgi:hypothetical protein